VRALTLALIRCYQVLVAPHAAGTCRHVPSCSAYAHEAIARHGVVRGIGHAVRRLLRCHPLGSSGYDPVP
jgi:putative membrane protein insertion efficiency factor